MSDYSPLTLASTDELLDELQRRSKVLFVMTLQQTEHNELKTFRRHAWQHSSCFEAVGIGVMLSHHLNQLVHQIGAQQTIDDKPA